MIKSRAAGTEHQSCCVTEGTCINLSGPFPQSKRLVMVLNAQCSHRGWDTGSATTWGHPSWLQTQGVSHWEKP